MTLSLAGRTFLTWHLSSDQVDCILLFHSIIDTWRPIICIMRGSRDTHPLGSVWTYEKLWVTFSQPSSSNPLATYESEKLFVAYGSSVYLSRLQMQHR